MLVHRQQALINTCKVVQCTKIIFNHKWGNDKLLFCPFINFHFYFFMLLLFTLCTGVFENIRMEELQPGTANMTALIYLVDRYGL